MPQRETKESHGGSTKIPTSDNNVRERPGSEKWGDRRSPSPLTVRTLGANESPPISSATKRHISGRFGLTKTYCPIRPAGPLCSGTTTLDIYVTPPGHILGCNKDLECQDM